MMKRIYREYREPVEYCAYCGSYGEAVVISGVRIWKTAVGGQEFFALDCVRCSNSTDCTSKRNCALEREARRKWREGANSELESNA